MQTPFSHGRCLWKIYLAHGVAAVSSFMIILSVLSDFNILISEPSQLSFLRSLQLDISQLVGQCGLTRIQVILVIGLGVEHE
jgi:hypothetical protein